MPIGIYIRTKQTIINLSKSHIGYKMPEEQKKKISIALKGKKKPIGFGDKVRKRLLGTRFSLKHRKKLSLAKIDKYIGFNNPHWKGGQTTTNGYIFVLQPNHPFCCRGGYIRRSHLVMEKIINRYLKPQEVVHHVNSIKDDDRPENLKLYKNNIEHLKNHKKLLKLII